MADKKPGNGAQDDAGQVSPPAGAAASAEPTLPVAPDLLAANAMSDVIRKAMTPPAAETEQADDAGETTDEDEDEESAAADGEQAGAEDEEEGEPDPGAADAGAEKPRARLSAEEWAAVLAKDGLQRIDEVPNKLRATVLEQYTSAREERARTEATAAVADQLRQEQQLRGWIDGVDKFFAEDPDAKLEWVTTTPEGAQYAQAKQYVAGTSGQAPIERARNAAAMQARAKAQFDRLAKLPADIAAELQGEITKRSAAQKYAQSDAGIELLAADVDELLSQGYERAASKRVAPAQRRAAQRQVGADRRSAVPRPDATGGRAAASAADISNITDPNELVRIGLARHMTKTR